MRLVGVARVSYWVQKKKPSPVLACMQPSFLFMCILKISELGAYLRVSREAGLRSKYVQNNFSVGRKSPAVHPYHLFVGTPLPVSGNSPPFHRELSIIPHRIRDKDGRPSEGESSRGGGGLLVRLVAGGSCGLSPALIVPSTHFCMIAQVKTDSVWKF